MMNLNRNKKICIYGLGTYELLSGSPQNEMGGAELQEALLASELSKNDFEVSCIVYDHGQPSCEVINRINLCKSLPKGYHIDGFVPFFKAIILTWHALSTCNADMYYYRGAGNDISILAIFCLLKRKKFLLGMASNKDLDEIFKKRKKISERISFWLGVKLSNYIICQNKTQETLLKDKLKKTSIRINSLHPVPENIISKKNNLKIIWVGTIRPEWKQPELFLKLAQEIPDANFQMIGGSSTNIEYYKKIEEDSLKIPNLEFVGFVPYPQVNEYFENASILVNTSSVEGFPNTFIQAWFRNVPVVSLNIDPDEIICEYRLGFHSKTFDQMIKDLKILIHDKNLREEFGVNARRYAEREFDSKKVIKQYIKVLENL